MTRRQRRELERERQAQLQRENARELLSQAPDDSSLSGRANAAYGGGGYNDAGYNGSYNGGYGSGAPASAASAPSTFSAPAVDFNAATAASAPSTFSAAASFTSGTAASAPSAPSSFAMPASAASAPSAFGAPATAASAPSTFSAAASAASAPSSFAGTAWGSGQPGAVQPGVAQSSLGQAATGQPGAAYPGAVQNPVDDGVDYQPTQIISAIKDEIIDDVAIRNWSAAASAKVAKAADAVSTASVISTASVASAASVTSAVSAHTAASAAGAQGLNIAAQATSAAANSANLTPQAPVALDQTPARGNPLETSNPVETNSPSEPTRLGCGTTPPVKRKGAAARRRAAFARVGQICAVSALALVTIVAPVSAAMMGADSPLNTALGAHRGQSSRQVISGKDSVAGSVDHSPLESSDVKLRNVPDAATKARIRAAYENPVVTCAPQQGASGDTTAFNTTPDVFKPMVAGTYTLSSPWGYRIHPVLGTSKMHAGQDMAAAAGTPIYAAAAGEVVEAGMVDSTGTVTIKHVLDGKIWYTSYLHMYQDGIFVKKGQQVKAGQLIAAVGSTGYSTGPHLHFEVRTKNDTADASTVDPMKWLSDHKAVELSTDCKSSSDNSTSGTGDGSGTGTSDGSTGTTDSGSSDGTGTGGTGGNSAGLTDNSNGSTGTSDSGTGTNDSGTGTNGGNTGTNGGTGANGNTGTSEGNTGGSNSDGSTSGGN